MQDKLSYKHACNTIRLLYGKVGFELPVSTLGEAVASEFNKDISNTPLAALYAFVDEQIALLRLVSFYFISAALDKENKGLIFYRLAIKQIKTLSSIRLLCTYGLDVNARMQLRLLYETSIVWARLRVDKQALDEFSLASTPELTNSFWHKYIAKSKTEKFLDAKFSESGHFWLGGSNVMIEELKKKISSVSHPSFLAAFFDTLYDWANKENSVALTEPSQSSHFTLSYATLVVSIPFSIKPEPPYGFSCIDMFEKNRDISPLKHPQADWDEYSQKIRDMFPTLIIMAVRFSEGLRERQDDKPNL